MKSKKYSYIFIIFVAIITGSCSLLLGPLSRLSIEALTNNEWKWEWVGEWSGYLISTYYPRSIKTYTLRPSQQPGFVVSYYYDMSSSYYLHISPEKALETIITLGAPPPTYPPDPIHLYVDINHTNIIMAGIHLGLTNKGIFSYSIPEKTITKERYLGYEVRRAILVGKILFFQDDSLYIYRWNRETDELQLFYGWTSGGKSIFPLQAEKEENSLLLMVTNDNNEKYWFFYDQAGNEKESMRFTTSGPAHATNWIGAVGQKGVYLLASTNSYAFSIYHLLAFQNNIWHVVDTKGVIEASINRVIAVDIIAMEGIVIAAYLVEPNKIVVTIYQETKDSLKKISEKTLSFSSAQGTAEGIDLFYDRVNRRLILGILHALPPDNHLGVSYFWIPWL